MAHFLVVDTSSILPTLPSGLASLHNGVATIVKQGAALGSQSSLLTTTVADMCVCRTLCRTHPKCVAFSHTRNDGRCAIGQDFVNLVTSPSATLVYTLPVAELGVLKADGLYYMLVQDLVRIDKGALRCEQMPGFRLAIAKTKETLDIIKSFYDGSSFLIGLSRANVAASLLWNDGTALDFSLLDADEPVINNNGLYFEIYLNKVDDAATNSTSRPLCQANFVKMEW